MMAMVSAMAARVGESGFGRWWRRLGVVIDCVIPLVLFAVVVASLGTVVFGLVH